MEVKKRRCRDTFRQASSSLLLALAMLSNYANPAEKLITDPNQDVVYGLDYLCLGTEPVVLQVPDFGDRF